MTILTNGVVSLKHVLRVVTTASYVDRDYPCLAVAAGRQISTYLQDEVEVDLKEYRNQILEDKEWIDLFVVKKSTIRGDFVPNETLGICAGKVRRVLKGDPVYQPSEYTMLMSSDNPSDIGTIICYMEQEGIPDRFDSKRLL